MKFIILLILISFELSAMTCPLRFRKSVYVEEIDQNLELFELNKDTIRTAFLNSDVSEGVALRRMEQLEQMIRSGDAKWANGNFRSTRIMDAAHKQGQGIVPPEVIRSMADEIKVGSLPQAKEIAVEISEFSKNYDDITKLKNTLREQPWAESVKVNGREMITVDPKSGKNFASIIDAKFPEKGVPFVEFQDDAAVLVGKRTADGNILYDLYSPDQFRELMRGSDPLR